MISSKNDTRVIIIRVLKVSKDKNSCFEVYGKSNESYLLG